MYVVAVGVFTGDGDGDEYERKRGEFTGVFALVGVFTGDCNGDEYATKCAELTGDFTTSVSSLAKENGTFQTKICTNAPHPM